MLFGDSNCLQHSFQAILEKRTTSVSRWLLSLKQQLLGLQTSASVFLGKGFANGILNLKKVKFSIHIEKLCPHISDIWTPFDAVMIRAGSLLTESIEGLTEQLFLLADNTLPIPHCKKGGGQLNPPHHTPQLFWVYYFQRF